MTLRNTSHFNPAKSSHSQPGLLATILAGLGLAGFLNTSAIARPTIMRPRKNGQGGLASIQRRERAKLPTLPLMRVKHATRVAIKIGAVIVTNKGKVAGIFTERDLLLKVVGLIDDFGNKSITKVMTPDPVRLLKDDKIAYVMHNMHVGRFRHIPIVNENDEPISIVSIRKINSYILDHFPEEITNLTEKPYRKVSQRDDA